MDVNKYINQLIDYGLKNEMLKEEDVIYSANKLISILGLNEFQRQVSDKIPEIHVILDSICNFAVEKLILENDVTYRDLFDTKIIDCIMPRPSEVSNKFKELYNISPDKATKYFYNLSTSSNYIRMDRINKNLCWKTNTSYGALDITINLSKPEKDPKLIALAKSLPQTSYPKCLLCYENVGYEGNINHPARQNHRVIDFKLDNENWCLQYSPYVYYNEHCIVFKKAHEPMKLTKSTFTRLLDFVELFPHYFLGSNADLPIVGGSILTHDHFQGGNYEFAMATTNSLLEFKLDKFKDIRANYLNWPLDVIRLSSNNKESLAIAADEILYKWKNYSHEEIGVFAFSGETPHNTITPISRTRNGVFELDLVLRNNRTDEEHPDGIFHPHQHLHHIKKENIGLIEVMGLAVLPARLKDELKQLSEILVDSSKVEDINSDVLVKHKEWFNYIKEKYSHIDRNNVNEILETEVGLKFCQVLECCSVFRMGDKISAIKRFVEELNK